ncbi:MAG: hypothetical protein MJ153_00070 [Clostridia bacterium]|nr:hypothetical protein [Clostridia bacterium]
MASAIVTVIEDRYIEKAAVDRLKVLFPNHYIFALHLSDENGFIDYETIKIPTSIHIIFDNTKYDKSEIEDSVNNIFGNKAHILFHKLRTKESADCIYFPDIVDSVLTSEKTISDFYSDPPCLTDNSLGRTNILFVFTSVENREKYIQEISSELLSNAEISIRLNLMPDYKWPAFTFCSPSTELKNRSEAESGSFTRLMQTIENNYNENIKILDYCSMDNIGYMNPGPFNPGDEIFNYHFDSVLKLIDSAQNQLNCSSITTNLLIVVQDYRRNEARMIAQKADNVTVLLSHDGSANQRFLTEELSLLQKSLPTATSYKQLII